MDEVKSHEDFEEKRKYPRIVIDSPADILYKMHQLQATIHDISPDGIQIRSKTEIIDNFNIDYEQITDENAPLLDVTFHLKLSGTDTKITAQCKMYYSNQLDDETEENFISGLKFVNFEADGLDILDAYFTEEMTSY